MTAASPAIPLYTSSALPSFILPALLKGRTVVHSLSSCERMLNTSVRRAARSCPNGSLPYRPASPSIAPFTSRAHQRRQSSSKPPIPPNNGSSTIPASSVKQVGASRAEKKPVAESRLAKRRAAKAEPVEEGHQINWTTHLPSVPNTDHIKQKGKMAFNQYELMH